MKVSIKLDPAAVARLRKAVIAALEKTAYAVKTDIESAAVVPKEHGDLERSGFVEASGLDQGKVAVVYDTPYARRLYWNPQFNFRQDKNPHAQGKWMDAYIEGENETFIQDKFQEFLKKESGGLIK